MSGSIFTNFLTFGERDKLWLEGRDPDFLLYLLTYLFFSFSMLFWEITKKKSIYYITKTLVISYDITE